MRGNSVYLGDAVYARFDGYGIELRLNQHSGSVLIYLEPGTIEALQEFWDRAKREAAESWTKAMQEAARGVEPSEPG
jgi:hypothetical protein